jgi:pimeloyl-ACP methyl ester carboxylesterase
LETLSLIYKNSTLNYRRFGDGKKMLFCFHGYGEDASSFVFLEKIIGHQFTIISLDFPFHGSTEWKEELLFTPDDLIKVIDKICNSSHQKISILGYSMGGRVALQLLQTFPDKIEKLILIAPDGLHNNIWHKLSTQTFIGNKLFSFSMNHPKWMFVSMNVLYKLGFFNKSIFNFVHYYLDDRSSRLQLYKRWTTMRKFNPDLHLLKKIIHNKKIPISIMFGRYDRVIVTKRGIHFQKNIAEFVTVKEIEAGHQLLKPKFAADIAALFRS